MLFDPQSYYLFSNLEPQLNYQMWSSFIWKKKGTSKELSILKASIFFRIPKLNQIKLRNETRVYIKKNKLAKMMPLSSAKSIIFFPKSYSTQLNYGKVRLCYFMKEKIELAKSFHPQLFFPKPNYNSITQSESSFRYGKKNKK